jgi:hypothetical protein
MECPICLEELNDRVVVTNCCHTFHDACMSIWLVSKSTCPICRTRQSAESDNEDSSDTPSSASDYASTNDTSDDDYDWFDESSNEFDYEIFDDDQDQLVTIARSDPRTELGFTIAEPETMSMCERHCRLRQIRCERCKDLWTLPAGTYKVRLDPSQHILDIVESDGSFITDARGPRYDWSGSFNECGFRITGESESIETPGINFSYEYPTVIIGGMVFRGHFYSFSLTDLPHSDEGVYNYVVNKYSTGDGKVGVVFSGRQNECDYPEYREP